MAKPKTYRLGDLQLRIMRILWNNSEATVGVVHEELGGTSRFAYTTIATMLRKMEARGLVAHREEGRSFIYTPAYSREQVTARFLNKVFDGAMDQLVLSLLEASDASAEDLKDLEKLIARARRQKQAKQTEGE